MFNSPFMQAGASKVATKGLLKTSKFSFNGIVSNLEKTVSTINQVVPLYNQVKPLISNSKVIINAFKSTKGDSSNKRRNRGMFRKNNFNPDVINIDVNKQTFDSPIKENQELNYDVFTNEINPTKPFFN